MGVSYKEVIERLQCAGKLKNGSALARVLGITPQALSNYKRKDILPSGLLIKFADIYGLYIDWLLTGTGPMYKAGSRSAPFIGEIANVQKIMAFTPEEMVCIDKLLKILRGKNEPSIVAAKHIIDTLSQCCTVDELTKTADKKKAV